MKILTYEEWLEELRKRVNSCTDGFSDEEIDFVFKDNEKDIKKDYEQKLELYKNHKTDVKEMKNLASGMAYNLSLLA